VVEPRPGGNFIIAAAPAAESAPDGYTLCVRPGRTPSPNEFLYKKIPYSPGFLHPDHESALQHAGHFRQRVAQVRTLDELAALAKAKPKTLTYLRRGFSSAFSLIGSTSGTAPIW